MNEGEAGEKFVSEETNRIIKRCIEKAKQISEVKPFKRPKKDFMQTMLKYKMAMDYHKSNDESVLGENYSLRTNYVTSKQHSSLSQLEELKPILLKDMKVNQIHYGHFLECEVISEPYHNVKFQLSFY